MHHRQLGSPVAASPPGQARSYLPAASAATDTAPAQTHPIRADPDAGLTLLAKLAIALIAAVGVALLWAYPELSDYAAPAGTFGRDQGVVARDSPQPALYPAKWGGDFLVPAPPYPDSPRLRAADRVLRKWDGADSRVATTDPDTGDRGDLRQVVPLKGVGWTPLWPEISDEPFYVLAVDVLAVDAVTHLGSSSQAPANPPGR